MSALRRRVLSILGVGFVLLAGAAATSPSNDAAKQTTATQPPAGVGTVLPSVPSPPAAIPLTDGWQYLADPHNVGLGDSWGQGGAGNLSWTPVTMPNDFNPTVSSSGDVGTVGWYQVHFTGPALTADRSWRIAFDGVRRHAQVWLNGFEIGRNSDPYAPFSLPASSLQPGADNLLIVRVDNVRGRGSLPEDWWNWGGIMGPVTLEPAGRLTIKDLGVMSELRCNYRCGDLLVEGTLKNNSSLPVRGELIVRATSPSGVTSTAREQLRSLSSGRTLPINFRLPVRAPIALWSPNNPALYTVHVDVVAGPRVEEADTLRTGMRAIQVHGGVLYLNGSRLWLHGASIHEDLDGVGAALTDGDIDTIVSDLRSVGANVTRAHYLLSPRLLDALDQAGIMVWEQAPVDHADPVLRRASGRVGALAALRSTILGARSHPSVIIDSVGNELSPTPDRIAGTRAYLDQAIPLARTLNATVPVALDTYCYPGFPAQKLYSKLDVLGISSYFGWYTGHSIGNFNGLAPFLKSSHRRYPKQALVVAEFGAESLFDGPPTVKGTYEFQSNYVQRTYGVVSQLPFMNGAIYWTLREFAEGPGWTGGVTLPAGDVPDGLHHKGLIAYDGSDKPAFAVAQQLFGTLPRFVH